MKNTSTHTTIINTKTKKIFKLLNIMVKSQLEIYPELKILSEYNKIKEEENKKTKDVHKKNSEVSNSKEEKPKTKRKYTKKTVQKDK